MIAYHMKAGNIFNPCFLIKEKYQKTSIWHLIIYALIVVGLAIIANIITTVINNSLIKG